MKKKPQSFNDGAVKIYRVHNAAPAGEMPVEALTLLGELHYHRRTVGVQRQYLAMQAQSRVDLLLRCKYRAEVLADDVAIPTCDGKQYRIKAVQVPEDVKPPVMDLTLERLEAEYGIGTD